MKNIKNLDNFRTPKFRTEYHDKNDFQRLTIYILHGYEIIDEVTFEDTEAKENYLILNSEDKKEIKEIFEDIYINYTEGI